MKEIHYSPGWLSVDDVAAYLGIKRGTVYKWIARHGLPVRKIGRLLKFRRDDIDRWMESQQPGCAPIAAGDRFLDLLRSEAPEIKKRFGVRKIGLFGSAVRGEARPDSDVDILVEFETPTFDRYMDLKFHLESLFGRPCDLVLIDTLKQGVRSRALSEAIYA